MFLNFIKNFSLLTYKCRLNHSCKLKVLIFLFVYLFFSLLRCYEIESDPNYQLEGIWKEVKGNTIFDQSRREALYHVQRIGDVYTGRMISLDNALTEKFQIRNCRNCSNEKEMYLGLSLLRSLKRKENGIYYGEFYDTYNRKWFDAKVIPISKTQINIRTYAIFPLFGRNLLWERGEEYYKKVLESEPTLLDENKQYYALELGSIDYTENKTIHLFNIRKALLKMNTPVYFFSKQGKLVTSGFTLNCNESELIIQTNEEKDLAQTIPVIFFERNTDWSARY